MKVEVKMFRASLLPTTFTINWAARVKCFTADRD